MPERIQLRRTKGWRKPEGAIYVGRPTRWGNPYRVGDGGQVVAIGVMEGPGAYDPADRRHYALTLQDGITADQAVALHRQCLTGNLTDRDPHFDELRAALAELAGHDLACWCPLDQPCHADVLLDLASPGDAR